MNLQAHLGRKMPPHLFKLNFCAARHAEFMALKGRIAEDPNSVPGNKNNCVSRCVYRMLVCTFYPSSALKGKCHPEKRKGLLPLVRHLMSKLDICSVSPLLTLNFSLLL